MSEQLNDNNNNNDDNNDDDNKTDEIYERKVMTSFVLRIFVSGYVIYLAYMLVFDEASKFSTMPRWCTYLFASIFTIFGFAFFAYAVRQMKRDKKK